MAINVKMQLSNSEGLLEIIVFEGLSHPVVIHPTIHGEPILTAQAFYYLEQLESVATIQFENGKDLPSHQEIEFLIDSYLYEYSKINKQSKISTKSIHGKYWTINPRDMYMPYDHGNTKALALDILNDPSVHSISSVDTEDNIDFSDWCLIENYRDSIFECYLSSMSELINKKVQVVLSPRSDRDGYMGKKQIVKCDPGLVDFYQIAQLDNLTIRSIKPDATSVKINSTTTGVGLESIPIRRVYLTKKYNPTLLSYYFSGIKEYNPLLAFVGFYNVIEYYFEEAPTLLGRATKNEFDQIKCVIELLASNKDISLFVESMDASLKKQLHLNIKTSSTVEIPGFAPSGESQYINELARWLYEIRCAIVHSKKTRKGKATAIFEPYTIHTENIQLALPILKWLSILCIEKDCALGGN